MPTDGAGDNKQGRQNTNTFFCINFVSIKIKSIFIKSIISIFWNRKYKCYKLHNDEWNYFESFSVIGEMG